MALDVLNCQLDFCNPLLSNPHTFYKEDMASAWLSQAKCRSCLVLNQIGISNLADVKSPEWLFGRVSIIVFTGELG
jgi:hypothetical protein